MQERLQITLVVNRTPTHLIVDAGGQVTVIPNALLGGTADVAQAIGATVLVSPFWRKER